MSIIHVTTPLSGIEALVESVQGQVSRMAYHYYRPGWSASYEDLLEAGMEEVAKAVVKSLPKAKFPRSQEKAYQRKRAYLLVAAKRAIIRQYRDGGADLLKRRLSKVHFTPIVSLDRETPTSLYDELSSPALLPTAANGRDFSLLYEVLDSLSDHYHEVVCMRFGLCGYGAHRLCEIAHILQVSRGVVGGRLRRALAELREHSELLTLVGGRGGRSGDGVMTVVGQSDEDDQELAWLMAEFAAIPSYVESNAMLFAQEA